MPLAGRDSLKEQARSKGGLCSDPQQESYFAGQQGVARLAARRRRFSRAPLRPCLLGAAPPATLPPAQLCRSLCWQAEGPKD